MTPRSVLILQVVTQRTKLTNGLVHFLPWSLPPVQIE
jgi:hypothetical protein